LLTFVANHADFARPNTIIGAYKTLIDTNLRPLFNGVGMQNYNIRSQPSAISRQEERGGAGFPSLQPVPLKLCHSEAAKPQRNLLSACGVLTVSENRFLCGFAAWNDSA
jgi:hypothetical protein